MKRAVSILLPIFCVCDVDETVASRQNVARGISLVDYVTMSSVHTRLTGESEWSAFVRDATAISLHEGVMRKSGSQPSLFETHSCGSWHFGKLGRPQIMYHQWLKLRWSCVQCTLRALYDGHVWRKVVELEGGKSAILCHVIDGRSRNVCWNVCWSAPRLRRATSTIWC